MWMDLGPWVFYSWQVWNCAKNDALILWQRKRVSEICFQSCWVSCNCPENGHSKGLWVISPEAPDEVYLGDESKKSPQKKATEQFKQKQMVLFGAKMGPLVTFWAMNMVTLATQIKKWGCRYQHKNFRAAWKVNDPGFSSRVAIFIWGFPQNGGTP